MNLPDNVVKKFGRSVLKFKKQSPHIFFVAGVVGSVTSTVLACRATLKLSEQLDEIRTDLDAIHVRRIGVDMRNNNGTLINEYSDVQYKKDIVGVYVKGGAQIAKLYAPAAIVGVASITALTGSHIQLSRRNAALMAAYAAVQKAYEDYRERVREELGDERELEIYQSVLNDQLAGNEFGHVDPNKWSSYARVFDQTNPNWEKEAEFNRLFVQAQQNYHNHLLQARGHVFLNEVYKALGFEHSSAGAVVGWIIGDNGDNYIDFGIFDGDHRFVNGEERSIILDFNVDGVIYDKI